MRRITSLLILLVGILAGAALTYLLTGMFVRHATGMALGQLLSGLRAGRTEINVDQPTVVRQIQQLQRLETVKYTMDKIIGGSKESAYLPKFLVGDRLLLLVHGEVIAGVDLARIQPGDITVSGRQISVHLPPAEVFTTRLDNARTRVYSRDTGLFSSADPNLETEVRRAGERQIEQAALQDGILNAADKNARTTVTSLLHGLGFNQITIQ
ncbi:MAG TPA: DUF4230 domain-containing protein [Terriglobales bacterium]|nr:DUF4230 domain-containing protein [Terriglobales bacterium]